MLKPLHTLEAQVGLKFGCCCVLSLLHEISLKLKGNIEIESPFCFLKIKNPKIYTSSSISGF